MQLTMGAAGIPISTALAATMDISSQILFLWSLIFSADKYMGGIHITKPIPDIKSQLKTPIVLRNVFNLV